jgi:hypothetical protein
LIADTKCISVNVNPGELVNVAPDQTVAHSIIRSDKQLNVRHAPLDLLDLASETRDHTTLHQRRMVRGCRARDAEP